ncbi:hypothetical protein DACRYDRAFT_104277 [Dacryopinax primogenitus]|uniref:Uncharacterized protein n=1 Tax=Dacryopinax primogenitus (strain DJM 731) TaxID=1858805 RepID=M5GAD4_DACPD|nr:uncharacterized protein DACRYDRAFT_104277 [Dacryopinax primogenitus]EJU05789.1 hypothetical protein DACRYDRAFT_104277 [Dacryopinax primogenitus]
MTIRSSKPSGDLCDITPLATTPATTVPVAVPVEAKANPYALRPSTPSDIEEAGPNQPANGQTPYQSWPYHYVLPPREYYEDIMNMEILGRHLRWEHWVRQVETAYRIDFMASIYPPPPPPAPDPIRLSPYMSRTPYSMEELIFERSPSPPADYVNDIDIPLLTIGHPLLPDFRVEQEPYAVTTWHGWNWLNMHGELARLERIREERRMRAAEMRSERARNGHSHVETPSSVLPLLVKQEIE